MSFLEVCSRQGTIQIHIYLYLLPLPLPYFTDISEWLLQNERNCLKLHFVPSQTITNHLIG